MVKYFAFFLWLLSAVTAISKWSDSAKVQRRQPEEQIPAFTKYRNRVLDPEIRKLSGEELVNYVNSHQNLWKAKTNSKFNSYSNRVKYGLLGVKQTNRPLEAKKELSLTRFLNIEIPESFDARKHWNNCSSLWTIRDQSSCGSCWAVSAVEAMSDRICVASKGEVQVTLSASDLMSCCFTCGFGCQGGFPLEAWRYWNGKGIVTGSSYTENSGCKPYPFPPCEHHSKKAHYKPCQHDLYPTPSCEHKCKDATILYKKDRHYGKSAYSVESNVEAIQKEILTHGPVQAAFDVYEDFTAYESGVYVHVAGKYDGGHAVKIVGWGEDNDVPYWLVANSWNTDFGEDGFFRILRGDDECGIESQVVAGLPDLRRKAL